MTDEEKVALVPAEGVTVLMPMPDNQTMFPDWLGLAVVRRLKESSNPRPSTYEDFLALYVPHPAKAGRGPSYSVDEGPIYLNELERFDLNRALRRSTKVLYTLTTPMVKDVITGKERVNVMGVSAIDGALAGRRSMNFEGCITAIEDDKVTCDLIDVTNKAKVVEYFFDGPTYKFEHLGELSVGLIFKLEIAGEVVLIKPLDKGEPQPECIT